ncbi:ribosome small subunit-dependent GTPase A [Luteolibacter sp. GHJ8]|jgi:ribosome biogenesis GTPase|uniref:Small ribosomal subunit biogenesis GTPase RsgA n=1 Tax=Luteolibacter rhizosphaerae TaxID=2989719 RepID=A0ABT3FYD6_9BACT|nr:ribosome small subunit-dependent GTPase A [Luteolibacter rhizosphaerae]MCW1912588.1 ribosome small subunit-dependent GTPase A [Luteolibacter rhizosphaerae]
MTLAELGWDDFFAEAFAPYEAKGWFPARLIRETTINYSAFVGEDPEDVEEIDVVLSGKVWHDAETDADLPAVGDWVAVELGGENEDHVIRASLPRKSCFSRKMPGKSVEEQVIGANVDVVAVVTDSGPDHNPRRMERYFTLIGRSAAKAVVLINKSDLCPPEHNEACARELRALSADADIHVTSALTGEGLEVLQSYLKDGVTMCVVGSSGVGKSTLVNQLYGEEWQWTSEVNDVTGKGRHTTTSRELVPLPFGGMLIDNPGMREIQMWTDEQTLRESFADVETMALECKFADCKHGNDKGCAIRAAVAEGTLDLHRLESFLRLDDEILKLRKLAKKRQMTVERWAKRNHRVKARNLNDRIQLEKDEKGDWE